MTTEDRSAKREDRSDAEKVVKALRANGNEKTQWMYLNEAADALADFVERGHDIRQLWACGESDYIAPYKTCGCRACQRARSYDAALARLREVLS